MAAAMAVPGPLLWGLNHLAFLPGSFVVGWGIAALVLFAASWLPPLRKAAERLVETLGRPRALLCFTPAATAAAAAAFWLLRSDSFFMGDGHLLAELTAQGIPYHGFDDMDFALQGSIYRLLGFSGLPAAFQLRQVAAVIAGALAVALSIVLLRRLDWEPWRKALAGLLFFTTPAAALYFGYVECYSFLAAFLTAFLISGLLAFQGRAPLWLPSLFYALALFFQLTALFSLPALAVLFLRSGSAGATDAAGDAPGRTAGDVPRRTSGDAPGRTSGDGPGRTSGDAPGRTSGDAPGRASGDSIATGPDRRLTRRAIELLAFPALAVLWWVFVHVVMGWDQDWLIRGFFGNEQARTIFLPLTGEGGVFSFLRIKDLVNLTFLVAPVPVALLLYRFKAADPRRLPAAGQMLLAQVAGVALLGLFIDRKLGEARDWDLLVAHTPGLILLAALLWPAAPRAREPGRKAVPVPASAMRAVLVSALLTLPFLTLMHFGSRSAVRLATVAADFPPFAKPLAYEELGKHFRLRGHLDMAVAMYEICVEAGPANPRYRVNLGTAYAMVGEEQKAAAAFAQARLQWEDALRHRPEDNVVKYRLAQLLTWQGEHARAAALFREVVPVFPNARGDLVQSLLHLGETSEAERLVREILADNPRDARAREILRQLTGRAGER